MATFFQPLILLAVCLVLVSAFPSLKHGAIRSSSFSGSADEVVDKLPLIDFPLPFKHYSGYLDSIEDIKLHYWFFESQNEPKTDPVVLWLNGGPGCSSLYGAFVENGPLRTNTNGTITLNPFSWNRNASILYLETPVLVGFSYSNNSHLPANNDERTAAQNIASLQSFFSKFPHLQSLPFYITGESYAGRYIPQLAVALLKANFPPHFKGVAIGNGYLDQALEVANEALYASSHGLLPNALLGVNPYNILADCDDLSEKPCSGLQLLTDWMNRVDVQRAIHIAGQQLPQNWEFLNYHLPYHWGRGSMAAVVKELVEAKQALRVVFYNGDLDTVCDFISDEKFVEQLAYPEDDPPTLAECLSLEPGFGGCYWGVRGGDENVEGNLVGGMARTFLSGRLVFLSVRGAGHMVPYDRPEAALVVLNRVLLQLKE